MILGFDIGNTSTSLGIFHRKSALPLHIIRYDTIRGITPSRLAGEIFRQIENYNGLKGIIQKVEGMVFSSVVTEINDAYLSMSRDNFGTDPLEVSPSIRLNFTLDYGSPDRLGPDRLVNAAAARHIHGGDCLIIDMGTATTLTVLLSEGVFTGGIIAPGVGLAMKALAGNASRLMEVPLEAPPSVVGRTTADCIKSGFYHGWIGMMEGFVRKVSAEYRRDFTVILTGGFSPRFAGGLGFPCIIDPLFTMKGLKVLYDLNACI